MRHEMQFLDHPRIHGDRAFAAENPIQCPPVAGKFFLGAIARTHLPEDHWPQTRGRNSDTFDAVGRLDALNNRSFAKTGQKLSLLPDPEILPTSRLHTGSEKPTRAERDGQI